MGKCIQCTHRNQLLIHLTYDFRQELEKLEKAEKEEVPGFTIANKLSPTRENK